MMFCHCRDEKRKKKLRRSIQEKETCINNLGNQLDQLHDALEKENQTAVKNSNRVSRRYQRISNSAIRQV